MYIVSRERTIVLSNGPKVVQILIPTILLVSLPCYREDEGSEQLLTV